MRVIRLAEFKAIIDRLVTQHSEAKIDFVYPKMHGGKRRSVLGQMTTYSVLLDTSTPDRATVRIYLDWSRDFYEPELQSQPSPGIGEY